MMRKLVIILLTLFLVSCKSIQCPVIQINLDCIFNKKDQIDSLKTDTTMAKIPRIRTVHNANSVLTQAQRAEKISELSSLTVQGQDESLRSLYERLQQGLTVQGEYRIVYHDEDGNVDFSKVPDIAAKEDQLIAMTENRDRLQEELDFYQLELEQEKEFIKQNSRHKPLNEDGKPSEQQQQQQAEQNDDDQTTTT